MDKIDSIARDILEEVCETNEIFEDLDMDLFETGYLDSFALLDIVVEIEDRLDIKVNSNDINKDKCKSVNMFTAFLNAYAILSDNR